MKHHCSRVINWHHVEEEQQRLTVVQQQEECIFQVGGHIQGVLPKHIPPRVPGRVALNIGSPFA